VGRDDGGDDAVLWRKRHKSKIEFRLCRAEIRRMGNTFAITALVAQRSKISGLILDLEKELATHRASLMHLDATLKLLDPTIKIHKIRATHRAAERSGYFAPGELSQRCQEAIRDAGPDGVTVDDVVRAAMADKGLDPGDGPMRTDFIRRFHWAMGRLQRDQRIDRHGHGRGVRWRARG
jgi:hypothetical protein